MKKLVLAIAMIGMGTFAMAQQNPAGERKMDKEAMRMKMEQKQQQHLDEMQKDLNLNASQVAQIKTLQDKRKGEMKAQMEVSKADRQAKMEQMKMKKQQMDGEMKRILTPEQYTKWESQKKAKMDERRAMMKEKGMKGGKKMKRGM